MLLVAVAGAGFLGREPERRAPAVAVGTDATAQPSATSPVLTQAVHGGDGPEAPPAAVPGRDRRVAVATVPDVLAGPAADRLGRRAARSRATSACSTRPRTAATAIDPLGPLCDRDTIIAEIQWSMTGGASFADLGPHVHVHVPVGIRLPADVAGTTPAKRLPPLAAVVVGRFETSKPVGCGTVVKVCEVGFDLEAVAWFEGSPYDARPFVGPQIDAIPEDWILHNQPVVGSLTVGADGVALSSALVRPARRSRRSIPAAARIVRRHPTRPASCGTSAAFAGRRSPRAPRSAELVWAVIGDVSLQGRRARRGLRQRREVGLLEPRLPSSAPVGDPPAGDRQPHDPGQLAAQQRRVVPLRAQRRGVHRPRSRPGR